MPEAGRNRDKDDPEDRRGSGAPGRAGGTGRSAGGPRRFVARPSARFGSGGRPARSSGGDSGRGGFRGTSGRPGSGQGRQGRPARDDDRDGGRGRSGSYGEGRGRSNSSERSQFGRAGGERRFDDRPRRNGEPGQGRGGDRRFGGERPGAPRSSRGASGGNDRYRAEDGSRRAGGYRADGDSRRTGGPRRDNFARRGGSQDRANGDRPRRDYGERPRRGDESGGRTGGYRDFGRDRGRRSDYQGGGPDRRPRPDYQGGGSDRRPRTDYQGGGSDRRPRPDYRDGSRDRRPSDRFQGGDRPRSGGYRGREGRTDDRSDRGGPPVNRNWGGVARRGAREVTNQEGGERASASDLWRQAVAKADDGRAWEPDETWVLEPDEEEASPEPARRQDEPSKRSGASGGTGGTGLQPRDLATGRDGAPSPGGSRRKLPRPVVDELARSAGADRGAKLANRIADATYAYEKERYQEARRTLRALAEEVPDSPAVRELYGLVLYRTGQWAAAARQLEAFREMSGSYDQHPVLADCYRALHRYDDAEQVWNDLREASPGGDLVAEGRMVAAGTKADRGDLAGAIAMLEKASRKVSKPQIRHLRQWYALADLYERAGDVPRARDLFNRVASIDPDAFDVRSRLRALR